ncbi:hypothetical protein [Paracidovorax avenae]|uniref:hypothetical protein n=1 Tax=Paracidovorax avenae TaxID=80867 RepID=UPI000FE185AE|nr:hypothetical protein [Paracidovorax avenae]
MQPQEEDQRSRPAAGHVHAPSFIASWPGTAAVEEGKHELFWSRSKPSRGIRLTLQAMAVHGMAAARRAAGIARRRALKASAAPQARKHAWLS